MSPGSLKINFLGELILNILTLLNGISFKTNITNLDKIQVCDISTNSNQVKKNSLFVCIEGTVTDGHLYAFEAIKNGATVIMTQKDLGIENQVIVEDAGLSYAIACQNYFGNPQKQLKIIGVTGTNGKTSTSKLIKHILTTAGFRVGLIGTIFNEIDDLSLTAHKTTPDAYELSRLFSLMIRNNCYYVVMEVSSHALDQNRIGDCKFEVACFTNLSQDHLDYHHTMENYFNAKLKLFERAKKCVVNADCEYGKVIIEKHKYITKTYSLISEADFMAKNINCTIAGVSFDTCGEIEIQNLHFNMLGNYSVQNALCAIGCAKALNINTHTIVNAISSFRGVLGRCEIIPTNGNFCVICDYAHTPDGLLNLLTSIKPYSKGRIVTVFGCGGDRDASKREIMGEIASMHSDFVIVTSDNPRSEKPEKIIDDIIVGCSKYATKYINIKNRKDAIFFAIKNAAPDDIIVLAGKGHEQYQILESGVIEFDERKIVKEACNL
jgi:UDP-N-acetylmuramoyl-L-alanyl-D-glutamate--2,6-diaminopimelate ligase